MTASPMLRSTQRPGVRRPVLPRPTPPRVPARRAPARAVGHPARSPTTRGASRLPRPGTPRSAPAAHAGPAAPAGRRPCRLETSTRQSGPRLPRFGTAQSGSAAPARPRMRCTGPSPTSCSPRLAGRTPRRGARCNTTRRCGSPVRRCHLVFRWPPALPGCRPPSMRSLPQRRRTPPPLPATIATSGRRQPGRTPSRNGRRCC